MKKQRFFTVKTSDYGDPVFYFTNLDGAMNMFKFLTEGNAVNLDKKYVERAVKKDKDDWRGSDYLHFIGGKPLEYHLFTETIEVHTLEEVNKLEKENEKKNKEFDKEAKKK